MLGKVKSVINLLNDRLTKRPLAALALIIIILSVLLTVSLVQRQTNYRSNASPEAAVLVREANGKLRSLAGNTSAVELSVIASQRKEMMLKLAKENPKEFINNILDQETIRKLPDLVKDNVEKRTTLVGAATVLVEEDEKNSKTVYSVENKSDKKRYTLYFSGKIPDITTGPEIEADTYTINDQAVVVPGQQSVKKTSKALGATTGVANRNILAMRILLSDNANQGYSDSETNGVLFNYSYSAKAFHSKSSYGLVNLYGTLTPYIRVPKSMSEACNDLGGLSSAADSAAAAAGYNLADYQHIIYLLPKPSISCTWYYMGTVGSTAWDNNQQRVWYFGNQSNATSANNASLFSHELGHNLGMHHANTLSCGGSTISDYSNCSVAEYGDRFDTMGYNYTYYPENNGPHKNMIGYLSPSNVIDVTGSGTYYLSPIEQNSSSPQVLRIKKSTGDYYFVDYRQPIPTFDSDLPSPETSGASIFIANSGAVENGAYQKTYLLDTTPGDSGSVPLSGFNNAALSDGRTFSDPASNLSITQSWWSPDMVALNVSYTPPCPKPAAPTNLLPSGQISAGTRNVTWSSVSGASNYLLRIDDITSGGESCTNPGAGDVCTGNLNSTSYSYNFLAGHSYNNWVHSVADCGTVSDPDWVSVSVPSGPTPTPTKNPTPTPTLAPTQGQKVPPGLAKKSPTPKATATPTPTPVPTKTVTNTPTPTTSPAPTPVPPISGQNYQTVCNSVNVRSGPSSTNGIVTQVNIGNTISVVSTVSGGSWSTSCTNANPKSSSSWYKISAINGVSVYDLTNHAYTYIYSAIGFFKAL